MYDYCRRNVPVERAAAITAVLALDQRLGDNSPALRARLGSSSRINRHDLTTSICSFVGDHRSQWDVHNPGFPLAVPLFTQNDYFCRLRASRIVPRQNAGQLVSAIHKAAASVPVFKAAHLMHQTSTPLVRWMPPNKTNHHTRQQQFNIKHVRLHHFARLAHDPKFPFMSRQNTCLTQRATTTAGHVCTAHRCPRVALAYWRVRRCAHHWSRSPVQTKRSQTGVDSNARLSLHASRTGRR